MRRLLTGYAVSFNHRHKRHGQLFQNRYKALICQEDERFERSYELKRSGYDLNHVAEKVAGIFKIETAEIFRKGRRSPLVDARGLFVCWCNRELGLSLTELAGKLEMTVSGVGYAAKRGEAYAKQKGYCLIE